MVSRFYLLFIVASGFLNCYGAQGVGTLPNVIIIMTDDHGYGDLECHGNPYLKTPALNQLAKESVRFTNFHVNATCMPTRAALLTARYPGRSGIWHSQSRINMHTDEITMADIFKANGYQTGIFGKWHLGDMYPFRPQDRGFQQTLIHLSGAVGYVPDYWGNDYFDDTYLLNNKHKKFEGYCTDVWFENGIAFMEEANKKRQPFFLYLSMNAPHEPYHVPEKYSRMFEKFSLHSEMTNYYGMISNIDDNVGRLTKKLEELNITENTIVIFLTDNGTAGGIQVDKEGFAVGKGFNAGMRGKKGSVYEGGHRVPFFIRWPGGNLPQDMERNQLVAHIDVLPTLIELIGLHAPQAERYDGRSFASLLKGKSEPWPDRVLFVQHQPEKIPQRGKRFVAMMGPWRLVNGTELYNIEQDPEQRKNIAKQHPEIALKLSHAYDNWWRDISKRYNEVCPIVLGSDRARTVLITSHDWFFGDNLKTPNYRPETILEGKYTNGHWVVEVDRPGRYEFLLRRWPEEATETGGFNGVIARLKIDNVDTTLNISKNASELRFVVPLENSGQTRLQTWITDEARVSKGVPYVRVTRLDK